MLQNSSCYCSGHFGGNYPKNSQRRIHFCSFLKTEPVTFLKTEPVTFFVLFYIWHSEKDTYKELQFLLSRIFLLFGTFIGLFHFYNQNNLSERDKTPIVKNSVTRLCCSLNEKTVFLFKDGFCSAERAFLFGILDLIVYN